MFTEVPVLGPESPCHTTKRYDLEVAIIVTIRRVTPTSSLPLLSLVCSLVCLLSTMRYCCEKTLSRWILQPSTPHPVERKKKDSILYKLHSLRSCHSSIKCMKSTPEFTNVYDYFLILWFSLIIHLLHLLMHIIFSSL